MQFSNVLSLVFATVVAAQDVATLFSEPNFQGTTFAIQDSATIGDCNPVASFPNVQSIKVASGHACVLYNTATCDVPYAAYDQDTAVTFVNGAFAAYQCAVAIPGGPFN